MKRQSVKWDFSNYDYSGFYGCPTCFGAANSNGQPYPLWFPEEVSLLCETHYNEWQEWHNERVNKGNMKSWVKE